MGARDGSGTTVSHRGHHEHRLGCPAYHPRSNGLLTCAMGYTNTEGYAIRPSKARTTCNGGGGARTRHVPCLTPLTSRTLRRPCGRHKSRDRGRVHVLHVHALAIRGACGVDLPLLAQRQQLCLTTLPAPSIVLQMRAQAGAAHAHKRTRVEQVVWYHDTRCNRSLSSFAACGSDAPHVTKRRKH